MAKVLILDQSKSMRNTLRERLEYEGFSTEAAEDEEAASNMCEKIPFDVILSDTGCKIPDKGVPFIVLSSEASIDSAVEAVRNGAQDYLTKPIDMNRLLQSILQQAVHVDGLGEVILRTVAYGFDRRVDRRFRRKNDERDSGVGNLAAPVRKDDVERYFLAHRRCSLLIFGGFGREAFEFETLAERVSHTF